MTRQRPHRSTCTTASTPASTGTSPCSRRWRAGTRPKRSSASRRYRYLIGGEAFDWLLLAERLLDELDGDVSAEEREALLFHGRPPLEIDEEEFQTLIGTPKYQAYLNYLYGVVVEEALQLAVEEEMAKEHHAHVWSAAHVDGATVYQRIYGRDLRTTCSTSSRRSAAWSRDGQPRLTGAQGVHLLAVQVPRAQPAKAPASPPTRAKASRRSHASRPRTASAPGSTRRTRSQRSSRRPRRSPSPRRQKSAASASVPAGPAPPTSATSMPSEGTRVPATLRSGSPSGRTRQW